MQRLKLTNFFNLSKTDYPELYEGIEYPWEAIKKIPQLIHDQLNPSIKGEIQTGTRVDDNVFIDQGTIIESGATIKGPAIIGKDCEIRSGAYIRGNVIIGDGVVVGNSSELKHTLVHNQAEIPHFAYIGDSIIGWEAHLGAGVKISNLKVNREPVVIRVQGEEYNTGMRKLGCIMGDGVEIGCNSVVNPGTLISKRTLCMANVSLIGYYPPNSFVKLRQQLEVIERKDSI